MKIRNTELKDLRHARKHHAKALKRQCGICKEVFQPCSKFHRFCEKCKAESELYHYSEWLAA